MSRALPADLDCNLAVEQVTDFLEEAMTLEARGAFEQHLVVCPGCMAYLRQVKAQLRLSKELGKPRPPPQEVARKLLEMFRAARGG